MAGNGFFHQHQIFSAHSALNLHDIFIHQRYVFHVLVGKFLRFQFPSQISNTLAIKGVRRRGNCDIWQIFGVLTAHLMEFFTFRKSII